MAHLHGSQSGRISGTVYGYDGGVDWHSGTMQMQSHLAQVTAPPAAPKFWSALMWFGFLMTLLATVAAFAVLQVFNYNNPSIAKISPFGSEPIKHIDYFHVADLPYMLAPVVFIFGLIVATKLRKPFYKRETRNYQNQLNNWQNSVICLRCGNTWLL